MDGCCDEFYVYWQYYQFNFFWSQKTLGAVLQNLRNVRERPPSLNVSVSTDILHSVTAQASYDGVTHAITEADITADGIDWDITLDSSQIDWDIGTVEETEENSNGLGPYEIVNASDAMEPHLENQGESSVPEVPVSEISWDISVDNPQVDTVEEVGLLNTGPHASTLIETHTTNNERSPFLDTEYRNKILDDLFEVCIYSANIISLLDHNHYHYCFQFYDSL